MDWETAGLCFDFFVFVQRVEVFVEDDAVFQLIATPPAPLGQLPQPKRSLGLVCDVELVCLNFVLFLQFVKAFEKLF